MSGCQCFQKVIHTFEGIPQLNARVGMMRDKLADRHETLKGLFFRLSFEPLFPQILNKFAFSGRLRCGKRGKSESEPEA